MTENIEVAAVEVEAVEAPVAVEAPIVEEVAAKAPKAASAKSEAPAPGTPEFAAWAWEHRNG